MILHGPLLAAVSGFSFFGSRFVFYYFGPYFVHSLVVVALCGDPTTLAYDNCWMGGLWVCVYVLCPIDLKRREAKDMVGTVYACARREEGCMVKPSDQHSAFVSCHG